MEHKLKFPSLLPDYNMLDIAIDRMRSFEPQEGYYLAFSGGKDSQVIYHIAVMAGVKFEAHYQVTTADPPDLVKFIREHYPGVIFDYPEKSMWKLIPEKLMPPTRRVRYCCETLKEYGGNGRTVLLGIRAQESNTRSKYQLIEHCAPQNKIKVMPIIDWMENDIWNLLKLNKIPYCRLYDTGFRRLGCLGCPMAGGKMMKWELSMFPKYKAMYLRSFERMLEIRKKKKLETDWKTPFDVYNWWTSNG